MGRLSRQARTGIIVAAAGGGACACPEAVGVEGLQVARRDYVMKWLTERYLKRLGR
jgi:hypothetical protein